MASVDSKSGPTAAVAASADLSGKSRRLGLLLAAAMFVLVVDMSECGHGSLDSRAVFRPAHPAPAPEQDCRDD